MKTFQQDWKYICIKELDKGNLDSYEEEFITTIRYYGKEELRNLSYNQKTFLRRTAEKYTFKNQVKSGL